MTAVLPSTQLTRRAHDLAFVASAAMLGAVVLTLLWVGVSTTRLWEDEAYNLSVPVNLAAGAGYSSDGILNGGRLSEFDPRISTGPVVLLPIAPLIAAGVEPVLAGRSVVGVFFLVLLGAAYGIGSRIGGRWAGLAAAVPVLVFDGSRSLSPLRLPVDVLGEVPAAAMLACALLLLPRRRGAAGVLLGLAVLCKTLAIVAVPVFVLAVVLMSTAPSWWSRLASAIRVLSGFVLPISLWEAYRFAVLGWEGYRSSTRDLYYFLASGGQESMNGGAAAKSVALLEAWSLPAWWVTASAGVVVAVWAIARRAPSSGRLSDRARCSAVVGICVTLVWLVWWLASFHTPVWIRHPAPGLLIGGVVLAALTARWLATALSGGGSLRRGAGIAAAVLLLVSVSVQVGARVQTAADPALETLGDQRAVADRLPAGPDDVIHAPWGRIVPLAFLSGRRVVLPGEGTSQQGLWVSDGDPRPRCIDAPTFVGGLRACTSAGTP